MTHGTKTTSRQRSSQIFETRQASRAETPGRLNSTALPPGRSRWPAGCNGRREGGFSRVAILSAVTRLEAGTAVGQPNRVCLCYLEPPITTPKSLLIAPDGRSILPGGVCLARADHPAPEGQAILVTRLGVIADAPGTEDMVTDPPDHGTSRPSRMDTTPARDRQLLLATPETSVSAVGISFAVVRHTR